MDETRVRHGLLELDPQLVDVDVDRAVALAEGPAPHEPIQVLPPHDPAPAPRPPPPGSRYRSSRRTIRPPRRASATSSPNSRTDRLSAFPPASASPSVGWMSSAPTRIASWCCCAASMAREHRLRAPRARDRRVKRL